MTADFSTIRQALEKTLSGISGIPPIAWENVEYDPSEVNKFLRAKLEPVEQRPAAIGADAAVKHSGLFLVDCFVRTQTTQSGPLAADELAQTVQDAFPYGLILTEGGNQIRIRYSERKGAIYDAPWYFVPVTIEWYSYI
jgi:hypothetical protein